MGPVSRSTSLPSAAGGDTPEVIEEAQEQGHVSLRDLLAPWAWCYGHTRAIRVERVGPIPASGRLAIDLQRAMDLGLTVGIYAYGADVLETARPSG